ncbi:MAG: hypothetical protein AAGU12_00880 [Clostridiales bacterium]
MILRQEKSTQQLFDQLLSMERDVKKELAAQESFIKQFQALAQKDREDLPIIDYLSCPAAIFERGGVICKANRLLLARTDLPRTGIAGAKISFLNRITDENYSLMEAAESVFYGKAALLSRLSYLLTLFCRNWDYSVDENYHCALLFPLPDSEGRILRGVVMLLE